MSKYGIFKPQNLSENSWSEEAQSLVGQIISKDRIVESLDYASDAVSDFVVIAPLHTDDYYAGSHDYYVNGIVMPKAALFPIRDCCCPTFDLLYNGCICGGFEDEISFRKLLGK